MMVENSEWRAIDFDRRGKLELILTAEEEAETILLMFFETDLTSTLLMQTSKELISQIKMLQLDLRASVQREAELKSDLLNLNIRFNHLVNEKASSKQGIVEMELKDANETARNIDARQLKHLKPKDILSLLLLLVIFGVLFSQTLVR